MLIFGLQQLLPGDPAMVLAGEERDPNVVAYLREKLHLDEPLPVRYVVLGRRRAAAATSASRCACQQPVLELIAAEAAGDDRARACWRC